MMEYTLSRDEGCNNAIAMIDTADMIIDDYYIRPVERVVSNQKAQLALSEKNQRN